MILVEYGKHNKRTHFDTREELNKYVLDNYKEYLEEEYDDEDIDDRILSSQEFFDNEKFNKMDKMEAICADYDDVHFGYYTEEDPKPVNTYDDLPMFTMSFGNHWYSRRCHNIDEREVE